MLFNLANQYAANEMFNEALNTYQVIVKNKMFTNAGKQKQRYFYHHIDKELQFASIFAMFNVSPPISIQSR